MTKVVRWRKGARQKVDAEVAHEELERIRNDRGGELTAGVVVDESRPEEAPLHKAFEWRDGIAAEEWRKHQARGVINQIEIVYKEAESRPARAYEIVKKDSPTSTGKDKAVYMSIEDILSDPELRRKHVIVHWLSSTERERSMSTWLNSPRSMSR